MDMPAAAREMRIQKENQVAADDSDRTNQHWLRDIQQQRERDSSAVGSACSAVTKPRGASAVGPTSSAVAVGPGANVPVETPAETAGETGASCPPTAPSRRVRVGMPVESLIVTDPVWIANFPLGCGVNKPRGWHNHRWTIRRCGTMSSVRSLRPTATLYSGSPLKNKLSWLWIE